MASSPVSLIKIVNIHVTSDPLSYGLEYELRATIKNLDWNTYHYVSLILQKRTTWGAIARPELETWSVIIEPRKTETTMRSSLGDSAAGWRIIAMKIDGTRYPINEFKIRWYHRV